MTLGTNGVALLYPSRLSLDDTIGFRRRTGLSLLILYRPIYIYMTNTQHRLHLLAFAAVLRNTPEVQWKGMYDTRLALLMM